MKGNASLGYKGKFKRILMIMWDKRKDRVVDIVHGKQPYTRQVQFLLRQYGTVF